MDGETPNPQETQTGNSGHPTEGNEGMSGIEVGGDGNGYHGNGDEDYNNWEPVSPKWSVAGKQGSEVCSISGREFPEVLGLEEGNMEMELGLSDDNNGGNHPAAVANVDEQSAGYYKGGGQTEENPKKGESKDDAGDGRVMEGGEEEENTSFHRALLKRPRERDRQVRKIPRVADVQGGEDSADDTNSDGQDLPGSK